MSWQPYVDNNLLGSGYVSQAAMYGLDGAQWATSPDFQLSATEVKEIVNGFDDPTPLKIKGLSVNGVKYQVIYDTPRSIYGKKTGSGVCLVKTKQCLLVAVPTKGSEITECAKIVEKFADYLISVNY